MSQRSTETHLWQNILREEWLQVYLLGLELSMLLKINKLSLNLPNGVSDVCIISFTAIHWQTHSPQSGMMMMARILLGVLCLSGQFILWYFFSVCLLLHLIYRKYLEKGFTFIYFCVKITVCKLWWKFSYPSLQ